MKVLFFGTPKFAEIVLQQLLKSKYEVVGVVCQPDKMAGRGNKLRTPNIVKIANEKSLPVFQFENLKDHVQEIVATKADVGVTASYGKIIPKSVLEVLSIVNVHPSMLPKYRGSTPIQSALLNGDSSTGVTIMKTGVGMDDGDIYVQKECEISKEDDFFSLHDKLAKMGCELLLETLDKIECQTAKLTKQDDSKASFVKLIEKEDALLNFTQSAQNLVNKVRAFAESPVAYFFADGKRIKVHKAQVAEDCFSNNNVGTIIPNKKRFLIQANGGVFEILRCQGEGGKVLDAVAFLNGFRSKNGQVDA